MKNRLVWAALVGLLAALLVSASAFAQPTQTYTIPLGDRDEHRFAWDPVSGAAEYRIRCGIQSGTYDQVGRTYTSSPSETLDRFFSDASENYCAAFARYRVEGVLIENPEPSNEVRVNITSSALPWWCVRWPFLCQQRRP